MAAEYSAWAYSPQCGPGRGGALWPGRRVHSWVTPQKVPSSKSKGDSISEQLLVCDCFGALGCEPFGAFAAPPAAFAGYQPRLGAIHCSHSGGAALHCGCSLEIWSFRTTGLVHMEVELCFMRLALRASVVEELSPAVTGDTPRFMHHPPKFACTPPQD